MDWSTVLRNYERIYQNKPHLLPFLTNQQLVRFLSSPSGVMARG